MAEYTVELRDVVENHNIFDFDYPFYDESKRPKFEQDFIRHFYFREIGVDTVDKFKFYLKDKMHTVFPYYNELFKTAAIDYSVLDNYNIKETTTMKRENSDTSSGESYAVGRTFDEQSAETTEDKTLDRMEKGSSDLTTNEVANGSSETTRNGSEGFEGEATQTVSEDKTKTANETENVDNEEIKKFLDTPQGAVNLDNVKYLTNLNHDKGDKKTTKELTATEDNSQTTNKSEETTKTITDNSETTDERIKTGTEEANREAEEKETSNATTKSTMAGEHRSSNDGAVRSRSEGTVSETIEHTRRGNIGVDTDADMIQKHIKLQKTLSQIQKLFFEECEDLFMLVW